MAKAAAELNLPYSLSTAGSKSIEEVGRAGDRGFRESYAAHNKDSKLESPRFYQLYMPHDDEITVSLLTRAHTSGFSVCIITVDTPQLVCLLSSFKKR